MQSSSVIQDQVPWRDGRPLDRNQAASNSQPMRWVVFACRTNYLGEVLEIIRRRGDLLVALVDNLPSQIARSNAVAPEELTPAERALDMVIPLTTPGHRYSAVEMACRFGISHYRPLIDPTAVIANSAKVGEGSVINAMSVVGADAQLGRFVHVNRSASIGHDVLAGDFVTFAAGCVVAGHVLVERGAYICTGAIIAPKMRIGANAIVGAGAVVLRDVPEGTVVLGNPARIVPGKRGGYGDPPVWVPPYPTVEEHLA